MSENVKSGMVLLAALLLGGVLVAGLVQQVELGRGKESPQEASPPVQAAARQPSKPEHPANEPPFAAGVAPVQSVPEQKPSVAPEANAGDVPKVDFFGKPLDAFGREVIERVGIAGQVMMAGRPLPGAKVVMRRVSRKIVDGALDYTGVTADPPGGQEWTTMTDADGKYAFYGLDDGHFGLEAHTDTACGVDDMTIRGGSIPGRFPGKPAYFSGRSQMSIELWPSGSLSGLVLTPDGRPVADATVYPCQIQYPTGAVTLEPVPQVLLSVTTGGDGGFHFPRLAAGRWQLAIRAAGYPDQKTDWLTTGEQPAEIRLNKLTVAAQTNGQTPDGTTFQLSDYKGRYVLLDFWAVWCGPCRAEMPSVKAVYKTFGKDPRFVLLGMDLDTDPEVAKKYISENGMGWKQVYLGDWSKSPVASQYRVEGIPCIILLDPEGKEVARDLRGQATMDAVRKALGAHGQQAAEEARPAAPAMTVAVHEPAPAVNPPTPVPSDDGTSQGVLKLNIDVGFDYYSEGSPMGLSAGQTDAPPLTGRPCKTLSAEPAYHCKDVYYGYLRLGNAEDNRFVFAVDDSDKSPWFGYFDRNNNGDLTDDGPPVIISANVEFDVPIVLSSGKTIRRPYRIWQWGNSETGRPGLRFYAVCHHQAKVHINGTTITAVAFERFNHDAIYHDDGIWIDLNGNNQMDEKTEFFRDGSTVMVNGRAFQIELDYP